MILAPIPRNEKARLEALRRYALLDTKPEQSYDDMTMLASYICETPMALMTLVDEQRQWFKSKVGFTSDETSREFSFCAHAILTPDVMIVPDATKDERFHDNPFVVEDPNIRFYAGAPMTTVDGYALGTICVLDRTPKTLTEKQRASLAALSRQAGILIEMRRTLTDLRDAMNAVKLIGGIIPVCSNCKRIRNEHNVWIGLEKYVGEHTEAKLSQGTCPDCTQLLNPDFFRHFE